MRKFLRGWLKLFSNNVQGAIRDHGFYTLRFCGFCEHMHFPLLPLKRHSMSAPYIVLGIRSKLETTVCPV